MQQYNKISFNLFVKLKRECDRYYADCASRLAKGDMFYPHGIGKCKYKHLLYQLDQKFDFLDGNISDQYSNVFMRNIILEVHFNMSSRPTHIAKVDLANDHYIFNSDPFTEEALVKKVVNIEIEYKDKLKHRFAVFCDLNRQPILGTSELCRPLKNLPADERSELPIPDSYVPMDWPLQQRRFLARKVQTKIYRVKQKQTGNVVLFPGN